MQFRDIRNLLSADCDSEYLHTRAKALNVDQLLDEFIGNE